MMEVRQWWYARRGVMVGAESKKSETIYTLDYGCVCLMFTVDDRLWDSPQAVRRLDLVTWHA